MNHYESCGVCHSHPCVCEIGNLGVALCHATREKPKPRPAIAPPKEKLRCQNRHCDWRGTEDTRLIAPNPFDPENDIIVGCPDCKDVNCLNVCCDEPGCWEPVSMGSPTPTGYRNTCYRHRPKP